MASKITLTLELISDGEWHGIQELKHRVGITENQAKEIAAFLFEYDLAKMDPDYDKLRITKAFKEFLSQKATC